MICLYYNIEVCMHATCVSSAPPPPLISLRVGSSVASLPVDLRLVENLSVDVFSFAFRHI